jgi:aminoglycoside 6-adenylyltransferase
MVRFRSDFFTTTPDAYDSNSHWLSEMGPVWLKVKNLALASSPEWLVIYQGGFKVDYLIGPATGTLHQLIQNPIYQPALRRGYRVLFDKDQSDATNLLPGYNSYCVQPPTAEEFNDIVSHLLLFSERTAKVLSRGELWWAKHLCDTQLKEYLLKLMEWHACAMYGSEHDIWRNGRFLHEWIHHDAVKALPDTFAVYEINDLWRAMLATLELGCWLAQATAVLWEFEYPYQAEQQITTWIRKLHEEQG